MSIDVNCTAWRGFKTGEWRHVVNVRNFIQKNYTPYAGGDGFLEGTTEKTKKVWEKAHSLILEEVKKGIVDVDTTVVSGIDNFAPGYIDKENEVIVGLQTDAPLKRIVNPFGGMRMAKSALEQYEKAVCARLFSSGFNIKFGSIVIIPHPFLALFPTFSHRR